MGPARSSVQLNIYRRHMDFTQNVLQSRPASNCSRSVCLSKMISQSALSHLEQEQVCHSVRSKHIAFHEFGCVGLSKHNAKITVVNASWMPHNTVATWYSCNECTHLVHADALLNIELLADGPLCTAFMHTNSTKMHTTEPFCQQKLLTKMTACQMQHLILSYTRQSELPLQPDKLC